MTTLSRFADARVFVIDDNPTNVAILEGLLSHAGLHNVYTATDARDALARIDEIDPDLVLLDLHMPHVDGFTVLRQISERAAGTYLPVMVLTADARPEATEEALTLGARDFLTKPFNGTEVVLRARNLLETRYLHLILRQHNVELRAELGAYEESERAEEYAREEKRARIDRVITRHEMQMAFQPVFDVATGTLVGVEALARFPVQPLQGPDRWFADAESVGMATELELFAVDAALGALQKLPRNVFLAVNVSPGTVLTSQLESRLPSDVASRVVIELTEHVPVEDYDVVNDAVDVLRKRGARIAVDDTGAGYAGFRHLINLRPDIVKLDISLTRGIDRDPGRRALASALVQFSSDTATKLIAEGVETRDEMSTLRQLHVGWAQGFYLGRPEPLSKLLANESSPIQSSGTG
jgi:EAL domain-containing protein (putative c-di-GMP-specific phosphodiesterase class I)/AmiR/NasT family two-component response regulator